MIHAVIIDDEVHCINILEKLLTEHCGQTVQVIDSFMSVPESLAALERLRPELVFLDVQIGEQTGFDLLKALRQVPFEVIFTTAYDQYAIEAFKYSAIDYLLKPIDPKELRASVEKVCKKISSEKTDQRLNLLFQQLERLQKAEQKISIPTIDGMVFLEVSQIIRCQSRINYTEIYLRNGKKWTVAKTLKEFQELLEPHNFYRVHNSHLVNLSYIRKYHKGNGGSVLMEDESEVEVSVRRKDGFLKRLSRL
jgi:two-component system LytT family response regulator